MKTRLFGLALVAFTSTTFAHDADEHPSSSLHQRRMAQHRVAAAKRAAAKHQEAKCDANTTPAISPSDLEALKRAAPAMGLSTTSFAAGGLFIKASNDELESIRKLLRQKNEANLNTVSWKQARKAQGDVMGYYKSARASWIDAKIKPDEPHLIAERNKNIQEFDRSIAKLEKEIPQTEKIIQTCRARALSKRATLSAKINGPWRLMRAGGAVFAVSGAFFALDAWRIASEKPEYIEENVGAPVTAEGSHK